MSAAAMCYGSWRLTLGCQVSCVMPVEVARFGMRVSRCTHLIPDDCSCYVLQILAVDACRIWNVCCLPAPAHQPFTSNSLDLSASEEHSSRNVRAPGTLNFGYEGVLRLHLRFAVFLFIYRLLFPYLFIFP